MPSRILKVVRMLLHIAIILYQIYMLDSEWVRRIGKTYLKLKIHGVLRDFHAYF